METKINPHELLKATALIVQKYKKTIGYGQADLLFDLLASWALKENWEDPDGVASRILNGKEAISVDVFRTYFDEDNPRCGHLLHFDVDQCLEFVLRNPKSRKIIAEDIMTLVNSKVPELDRMDLIGDAILSSESEVLEAYSRLLWYALCNSAYQHALSKKTIGGGKGDEQKLLHTGKDIYDLRTTCFR